MHISIGLAVEDDGSGGNFSVKITSEDGVAVERNFRRIGGERTERGYPLPLQIEREAMLVMQRLEDDARVALVELVDALYAGVHHTHATSYPDAADD